MNRETNLTIAALGFGILSGCMLAVVLMAINVPQFTAYPLSPAEKADWEHVAAYGSFMIGSFSWLFFSLYIVILIAVLSLFLKILAPQAKLSVKTLRSVASVKYVILLTSLIAWAFLIFTVSDSLLFEYREWSQVVKLLIYVVGTAILWFIAGEQGWAGDLSSWKMTTDARPVRTLSLGALNGVALFAVTSLFERAANKYFILVSEVFDGSGETSFLGFKQNALGAVVQFSLEFMLIAGFALALAPVERTWVEVRSRLVRPVAALAVISLLLFGAYQFADKQYDLGKPSLAAAIAVPDMATTSRTIVVLAPAKKSAVLVQDWPLQASGWGFAGIISIDLAGSSLQKVASYLQAHPGGTIFTFPALSILMNGYYSLGDVDKGQAWQIKAADANLIARLQLLGRFKSMPITEANIELFRSFIGKFDCTASARLALAVALAYQHFGKSDEAKGWREKAKALGAKEIDASEFERPFVKDGVIKGRVFLNSKPLANSQVALLGIGNSSKKSIEDYRVTEIGLGRTLVAVARTATDGTFKFTALGNGQYLLAIMTGQDTISSSTQPGRIRARNVPAVVELGPATRRELGTIAITTEW